MPPSRSPPSRSRSPRAERNERPSRRSRSRSRSPRRDRDNRERRPARNDRGFRWKDKKNGNANDSERRSDRRLERGYRERDDDGRRGGRGIDRDGKKDTRTATGADVTDKFGVAAKFGSSATKGDSSSSNSAKDTSKAPEKAAAASSAPVAVSQGEPMIIVHVNDRLGTKAAIPCLASDPIKMFKAMVAARIGREPHEILLKRQGERPFKDQLTLEDYGVSNGVQLDLEVDTGD